MTKLRVKDEITENRELWEEEVQEHARTTMSCADTRRDTQQLIADLRCRAASQKEGSNLASPDPSPCSSTGVPASTLTLLPSTILQARARLRAGRACGPDGISIELLKALSWKAVRCISRVFVDIFEGRRPTPKNWQDIYLTLMPKTSKLESIRQTRSLLVGNTLGKWYLTCITIMLEKYIEPHLSSLGVYGFSTGRHCWEIASALKCIAQRSSVWGKDQTAWLLSCDIARAFDAVTLRTVARAMDLLSIPSQLQYALLEPLSETHCTVIFEGVTVPGISWDKSLRTGGTESPIAFNLVAIAMWRDVVARFDTAQMGYEIPDVHNPAQYLHYSHALWADNVFLVAKSAAEAQKMTDDFTSALRDWGMEWKEDSLELMVCGSPCEKEITVQIWENRVPFKRVQALNVLGFSVPNVYGSQHDDVAQRIQCARRAFFAQLPYFTCRAMPFIKKFRRYQSTVQCRLMYGGEAITLDGEAIRSFHAFEGVCLLRMLGKRKPGNIGWDIWRPQALDIARQKIREGGFPSAVQMLCWKSWGMMRSVQQFICAMRPTATGQQEGHDGSAAEGGGGGWKRKGQAWTRGERGPRREPEKQCYQCANSHSQT